MTGSEDLPGLTGQITDDASALLLAHEPVIFPYVPARYALSLSGHTHGAQIKIFGATPWVPYRYGSHFAYGHIVEVQRHLITSGGLGVIILPLRLGTVPKIVEVQLG